VGGLRNGMPERGEGRSGEARTAAAAPHFRADRRLADETSVPMRCCERFGLLFAYPWSWSQRRRLVLRGIEATPPEEFAQVPRRDVDGTTPPRRQARPCLHAHGGPASAIVQPRPSNLQAFKRRSRTVPDLQPARQRIANHERACMPLDLAGG